MRPLPPLPSIREIVRMYKLTALKNLSQNFLLDAKLCHKIVKTAGDLSPTGVAGASRGGCHVVEVGPGPGGLTRAIIERAADSLLLVEKDRRFLPALDHLAAVCGDAPRVRIVHGDILTLELAGCFHDSKKRDWDCRPQACPVRLVGNLPFNISNPLLVKLLRDMSTRSGLFEYGRVPLVLTFQKEVAQRIVAEPYGDQRCRLSAISQMYADCEWVFTIPGAAFVPPPKVDAGVVRLAPRAVPLVAPELAPFPVVEKLLRVLFNQRQKYCANSLGGLFPPALRPDLTSDLLAAARVDGKLAAYMLSNDDLVALIGAYQHICARTPGLAGFDHRQPQKYVEIMEASAS